MLDHVFLTQADIDRIRIRNDDVSLGDLTGYRLLTDRLLREIEMYNTKLTLVTEEKPEPAPPVILSPSKAAKFEKKRAESLYHRTWRKNRKNKEAAGADSK